MTSNVFFNNIHWLCRNVELESALSNSEKEVRQAKENAYTIEQQLQEVKHLTLFSKRLFY